MFKRIIISLFLVFSFFSLKAQVTDEQYEKLEEMLSEYIQAMERESITVKEAECDFIIESCKDSVLRQKVAIRLYDHYVTSSVMGDEAVAIHIFDTWFADKKLSMGEDFVYINAQFFADFNRSSLLGVKATPVEMENNEGGLETMQADGRQTVLFFYSSDCSKCKIYSMLLRHYFTSVDVPLKFYAIYIGTDQDEWQEFINGNFIFEAPNVEMHHLWDPENKSDFRRLYGITQTPRLFLLTGEGYIAGRALSVDALSQLVTIGKMEAELAARCPVGELVPDLKVRGLLRSAKRSEGDVFRLRKLRGNPSYILFYTRGCANCDQELAASERLAQKKGVKVLEVDLDEIMYLDPDSAVQILDSFDLTSLPYVVELDKKGRVLSKALTFRQY